MNIKSIRHLSLVVAALFLSATAVVAALSPSQSINSDKNQDITLEILNKLDRKHFVDMPIDDDLSQRFLNNYLNRLDPNKAFFYQSDIDEFKQYAAVLDDLLKKGDNGPGFIIYARFKQRLEERLNKTISLLEKEAPQFDFAKDEVFESDREEAQWLVSPEAADEFWRKRIKSFLLSQKLSNEPMDEAIEQLVRRYNNQLTRVGKNTDDDVYEIYINSFTELYDPHTTYLAPRTSENFNINMSLSLEGIGAVLQTEDEHTKVVRLVTGGPAHKQGELRAADLITGVAQGDDGEIIDVIGWRLDEVVDLIRGPKGSIVRLQIEQSDAAQKVAKVIRIRRDKVKLEDQAAQKAIFTVPHAEGEFKIGVINIPAFYIDFQAYRKRDPNYRSTTRDVLRLLNELHREKVDGIVLDLRNNGGGSLQEATTLTDLFIDKGPVVQIGKGTLSSTTQSRYSAHYRGPLLVMINRLSASASEIFAGAIQDYQRGLVVGTQSFGKGTVQSLTPLDSKGDLKITESKFYRVSGDSTQHRGVIPDIEFPKLLDFEKIGESSYETALAWSKTKPVKYERYLPIHRVVSDLTHRHHSRTTQNPDFIFLSEQQSLVKQYSDKAYISLNESVRLKEKQAFEETTLSLENKRRKAKGEKPYKDYASLEKSNEIKSEERAAAAGQTVIDTEDDAMLREAGFILRDFVDLLKEETHNNVAAKQ